MRKTKTNKKRNGQDQHDDVIRKAQTLCPVSCPWKIFAILGPVWCHIELDQFKMGRPRHWWCWRVWSAGGARDQRGGGAMSQLFRREPDHKHHLCSVFLGRSGGPHVANFAFTQWWTMRLQNVGIVKNDIIFLSHWKSSWRVEFQLETSSFYNISKCGKCLRQFSKLANFITRDRLTNRVMVRLHYSGNLCECSTVSLLLCEEMMNTKDVAKFQPPLCGVFWISDTNYALSQCVVLEYVQ